MTGQTSFVPGNVHCNHWPRERTMPNSRPAKKRSATFPKATIARGFTSAISRQSQRVAQISASAACGVRLLRGRHLTIFVTYTRSRVMPTDQSARSKSCPLGPTNGTPYVSSTPPGPSPTSINGASIGPVAPVGPWFGSAPRRQWRQCCAVSYQCSVNGSTLSGNVRQFVGALSCHKPISLVPSVMNYCASASSLRFVISTKRVH